MYTNQTNIEKYLDVDLSDKSSQISEWIEEVDKYIDTITRTKFEADEESQDYYYDGNGKDILFIDDFISVDSVELGDEKGENMEVIEAIVAPKRVPIYKLIYNYFTRGTQNVKVIGKRGYSESAPDDIKRAATILTAGMVQNNAVKNQEKIGDYSVSYLRENGLADASEAMKILKAYQKNV